MYVNPIIDECLVAEGHIEAVVVDTYAARAGGIRVVVFIVADSSSLGRRNGQGGVAGHGG